MIKLTHAQFNLLREFGKGRLLNCRHAYWKDDIMHAPGINPKSIGNLWRLGFISLDDGDYWSRAYTITNEGMKYLDEHDK